LVLANNNIKLSDILRINLGKNHDLTLAFG
jgi:hypothetical protein